MYLQRLKIKASYWLEHRIKYVGTFMSGTFTLIIGFLLLLADYLINLSPYVQEQAIFDRLSTTAVILISVILGISLTTFSVIFVVMQLASSQFSPRILRHFLANDVRIQQFIGLYIGTLSLCILPQAASAVSNGKPYLITLSVGLFFALRCLVWSYPRMITYLSVNMNVAAIVDKIKLEVVEEINTLYRDNWQPGNNMLYIAKKHDSQNTAVVIRSPFKTGYLESVDYMKLEKLVIKFTDENPWAEGIIVHQRPVVGEFIMQSASTLFVIELKQEIHQQQCSEIETAFAEIAKEIFSVHTFRSYTQDINFGVRKLVDIAIKAISPAVNDPTTCLNCIDHLGDIARQLQLKQYPSTEACKMQSQNIIVNEFNFDQLIDFCFDQIFQWGKEDPTVVRRLIQTLTLLTANTENPFNLMILIREVQDMDIPAIYNTQNVTAKGIRISAEKMEGVLKELQDFKATARRKITLLKEKGLLEYQPVENPTPIELKEKEAIEYLLNFGIELKSH
jgi:uncharacterized membrane protein